jgi:hypothetical protein
MSLAHRCEICDGPAKWQAIRRGDVVMSWACVTHLDAVCEGLQRDFEVTELVVTLFPKAVEWAQIGHDLKNLEQ